MCGCICAIVYTECDIYSGREIAEVVVAVLVGTQEYVFFLFFFFFFVGKGKGNKISRERECKFRLDVAVD